MIRKIGARPLPEPRIARRDAPTPRRDQLGHNHKPGLTRTEPLLLVSRQRGESSGATPRGPPHTPPRLVHSDALPLSNGSVDRDDITHGGQRRPDQVPLGSRRGRREEYGEHQGKCHRRTAARTETTAPPIHRARETAGWCWNEIRLTSRQGILEILGGLVAASQWQRAVAMKLHRDLRRETEYAETRVVTGFGEWWPQPDSNPCCGRDRVFARCVV